MSGGVFSSNTFYIVHYLEKKIEWERDREGRSMYRLGLKTQRDWDTWGLGLCGVKCVKSNRQRWPESRFQSFALQKKSCICVIFCAESRSNQPTRDITFIKTRKSIAVDFFDDELQPCTSESVICVCTLHCKLTNGQHTRIVCRV